LLYFSAGGFAEDEQEEDYVLEEMVVTASKRETKLQETPISISAFSGYQLERANLRDFNEVITFIPGASEENSWSVGLRTYQLRGVAQGPGDPTVGYYIDDSAIYIYGLPFAPMGRSFDLERVEALRGPQSTLYGNGSMGGTIRFIPKAPNLVNPEVHMRVGYSSTDGGEPSHYIDGALSLPVIKDKLAVRLVAQYEELGGYQETVNIPIFRREDFNDADLTNLRGSLLMEPCDWFTLKLLYTHNESYQDGTLFVRSLDPPENSALPGDSMEGEFDLYSATLIFDLGFATLNTTTTYMEYKNQTKQSYIDFSWQPPGSVIVWEPLQDAEGFNNETRLVSAGDGPFQWLAGVFYADTESISSVSLYFLDGPALWPGGASGLAESESISFFGEASWSFFDGKLTPLVGLRYFEDDRFGMANAASAGVVPPEPDTFDSVNPRFNLTYQPSIYSLYYLNVAKGFRSGNFNDLITGLDHLNDPDLPGLPWQEALDSDEIWSYEIGSKLAFQNGRLVLDVALYYLDWQNQIQSISAGIINAPAAYQVGDAEIYGIDLGVVYYSEAIPGLTLNLAGNWNNAEITKIYDVLKPALLDAKEGDRPPFVPEWTLAISANYAWQVTEKWAGLVNLSYNHIDAQPGQFDTGSYGDTRDLLRARIGLQGDRFGIYLFGNNLLGEDGAIYAQTPAGAIHAWTQDHPRTLGIEVAYKY